MGLRVGSGRGGKRRKAKAAKAAKPGLMTRAAAARALGVAPARINRWASDGAPVAVPGKRGHPAMYDLEALRAWKDARPNGGPDASLSLFEEKAKLAQEQRRKLEFENAVRAGELVERADVVAEGRTILGALKAKLLALPRAAVVQGLVLREHEPGLRELITEALREIGRWKTVDDAEPKEKSA